MNRKLLAAVVSGTLAVSMAAQVQAQAQADQTDEMQADEMQADEMQADEMQADEMEVHEPSFTLYGSVRSGILMRMSQSVGTSDQWDVGTIGDQFGSLIGVRSSTELGGGMTAGLNLEKSLGSFNTRHQNVWLSGAFGTVTLGQQSSPYNSNTGWDNTNLFGGATGFLLNSRVPGAISYQSNPGGPFSFSALVSDSIPDNRGNGPMDQIEVGGTLSAGSVSFGAGYHKIDAANPNNIVDMNLIGGMVSGSLGGVGWAVGFETGTRQPDMRPTVPPQQPLRAGDLDRFGFNVDYTTEAGRAYVYYEDSQVVTGSGVRWVGESMVFGYEHTIGPGVIVITEYQLPSSPNPDQLGVVVRVDF